MGIFIKGFKIGNVVKKYFVDDTLTEADYPPSAKKVGDEIGDLKSELNDIAVNIPITPTWGSGYVINANGNIGTDSASCVSGYIESNGLAYSYTVANGYKAKIAEYNANKSYIAIKVPFGTGSHSFRIEEGHHFRIQVTKDNGTLSPSDVTSNIFAIHYSGYTDTSLSISGKSADAYETGKIRDKVNKLAELVPYPFALIWTAGKYIISGSGIVGIDSRMACTEEYYTVSEGQKLAINLYANGTNECAIAFYDTSKVYDSSAYVTSDGESIVTVPFDGYARFSTRVAYVSTDDAYVRNYVDEGDTPTDGIVKNYFNKNQSVLVADGTFRTYSPTTEQLDYSYKGDVTPEKRFLAIGFDDFRNSDFSAIIPLFEKYLGRATFNRVATSSEISTSDKNKINSVIYGKHEMGDHTFMHYAFPYEDALFNGQNPSSVDGNQIPYPTNAQLRDDTGNGRNAFYLLLTSNVNATVANSPLDASATWGSLTDEQCQTLREYYSVYKNPTLSALLDELSNQYLGTSGTSAGSFDSATGKYTGGIFTGCSTSANHEVWERILQIVQCYYKEQYGLNWELLCWSWPGEYYFGRGFSTTGYLKNYDEAGTIYYNMNARFESSLYTDELGNAKVRSFTDVLREFGYKYTHDYIYPSRLDYLSPTAIKAQFYLNEHMSKQDGVLYPTNRTVTYSDVANSYPSTFFTSGKTKGSQMYDATGAFRNFIEALRHDTAHGLVHGEVIDSVDNYSMRVFFEEALRFCKSAGIDVITKAEAYDVCFNHPIENGNLIYNPMLVNSAEEYFTDATNIPTNPDGYDGSCSVTEDASGNILVTTGETTYIHYGIPIGKIKYTADAKGNGTITIYLIKCGSAEALTSLEQLASISVSESDFTEKSVAAVVPNNPMVAWTPKLEGRDNKVMGLKIVYSNGLQIKNIRLTKE